MNAKISDMVKLVAIGSLKPYKGNPLRQASEQEQVE